METAAAGLNTSAKHPAGAGLPGGQHYFHEGAVERANVFDLRDVRFALTRLRRAR